MCQIFGLNSALPFAPQDLLRGFLCRGGGTGDHKDGWGIASSDDQDHFIQVRETSAFNCCHARELISSDLRTVNLLAHVRKATIGPIATENCHPFSRHFWGRQWIFAHNGDLKNFNPHLDPAFLPRGDTDSEAAFCWLLTRLMQDFGNQSSDLQTLATSLARLAAELADHGTINFILLVGEYMFVHGSTDLHWSAQQGSSDRVRLIDPDLWVETHRWQPQPTPYVVVATHPITEGHDWQAFRKNELKVFAKGQEIQFDLTSSVDLRDLLLVS